MKILIATIFCFVSFISYSQFIEDTTIRIDKGRNAQLLNYNSVFDTTCIKSNISFTHIRFNINAIDEYIFSLNDTVVPVKYPNESFMPTLLYYDKKKIKVFGTRNRGFHYIDSTKQNVIRLRLVNSKKIISFKIKRTTAVITINQKGKSWQVVYSNCIGQNDE